MLFEVRVNPQMNVCGRPSVESNSAALGAIGFGARGRQTSDAFEPKGTHSKKHSKRLVSVEVSHHGFLRYEVFFLIPFRDPLQFAFT